MIQETIQACADRIKNTPWLREILELTYAYDITDHHIYYNKTLFKEFSDCSQCKSYDEYYQTLSRAFDQVKNDITYYYGVFQTLQSLDVYTATVVDIMSRYCEYLLDMIQIAYTWLPFEIEKMWYTLPFWEEEILHRLKQIAAWEQKRFGTLVKDDRYEASRVIYYLETSLKELWLQRLTYDEIKQFTQYIKILKEQSKYCKEFCDDHEDHIEYIMTGQEYFAQPIHRSIYVQIFAHVFAIYGIEKPIRIESRSSMYDGVDAFCIPDSPWYETLSLQRVLELVCHEIEIHYLVQHNWSLLLPITDWANSLFKEEWLAKFMEEILDGATLINMDITPSIIQLLACEILWWDDCMQFLKIYYRLRNQQDQWLGYFLRRKRNYAIAYPWTQHKDITYSRWRFAVRWYLMDWWDFLSLYYAKVDFHDIALLSSVISQQQKQHLLYPLFITERVLHRLLWDKRSWDDLLAKKYPFIDFASYPSLELNKQQTHHIEAIIGLIHDNLPIPDYFHSWKI